MTNKYTLLKNKITGRRSILNNETGVKIYEDESEVYGQLRKIALRNMAKRAENAVLRELTGTSARAAREDMGL